jgi:hypothetical protein
MKGWFDELDQCLSEVLRALTAGAMRLLAGPSPRKRDCQVMHRASERDVHQSAFFVPLRALRAVVHDIVIAARDHDTICVQPFGPVHRHHAYACGLAGVVNAGASTRKR